METPQNIGGQNPPMGKHFLDGIAMPVIYILFFLVGSIICFLAGAIIEYKVIYSLFQNTEKDDKATTALFATFIILIIFVFKLFYPFYQKGSTAKYIAPFRWLRIFIFVVSVVCVFVYTFSRLRDVDFKPANELLKEENEIIQKYDERRRVLDNEVTAAKDRINRFDNKSEELANRLAMSRSAQKRAEGRAVLSTLSKDQSLAYVNLYAQYEEQKNDLDSLKKVELDAFRQKKYKNHNSLISSSLLTINETLYEWSNYTTWGYNLTVVLLALIISCLIEVIPIYTLRILQEVESRELIANTNYVLFRAIIAGSLTLLGLILLFPPGPRGVSNLGIGLAFLVLGALGTAVTDFLTKELKEKSWKDTFKKSIVSGVITLFLGFITGIVFGDSIDMGSAHSIGVAIGSGALGKFVSDYLG